MHYFEMKRSKFFLGRVHFSFKISHQVGGGNNFPPTGHGLVGGGMALLAHPSVSATDIPHTL